MAGIRALRNIFTVILFKIIQYFATLITNFIHRGPNEPITPIREDCLLGSASSLARRIRTKKITSAEAVRACVRRIEEINDTTNCIVTQRFEEALKDAEEIDRQLADSTKTPEEIEKETPFLGVPFTVKDGIGVKGLVQSSGVVARKNTKAAEDSEAVAALRKAGAIPLGTTNVPEMMSWWEANNKLYGRTKNPYHSKFMVGGSSGGEAAILSAAGSMMGLGSDLGGSIRLPAFMCGIFGHKPSPGLIRKGGMIPNEEMKDMVIGPMSKFAEDLRPMLKVLSQVPLKLDETVDIKKLRYFYIEGESSLFSTVDPLHPDIKEMMKNIIDYFSKKHGITVNKVDIPLMKRAGDIWFAKVTEGGGKLLEKNFSVWNVIKTGLGLTEHTLESEMIPILQRGRPALGSKAHKKLIEAGETLTEEFQKLLGNDGVLFYPPSPVPPQRHGYSLFHAPNIPYTAVFNVTHMPVTEVPIKQTEEGLPIGVQVAAARNQDRLTLAVAEELEKAFEGWKPPPSQPKW